MSASLFPTEPVPPAEFLGGYLHGALDRIDTLSHARGLSAEFGLVLTGEGGGEWVLALDQGRLRLRPGSREDTPATFVQRVEHWRGALWEGQGAALGRAIEQMFRAQVSVSDAGARLGARGPGALEALGKLDGLLRVEVTGAGSEPWQIDLRLGPGELPARPTTTLSIDAAGADRLLAGSLGPLEAVVSGRLRLHGDLRWLLRLQAAGRVVGRAFRGKRRRSGRRGET